MFQIKTKRGKNKMDWNSILTGLVNTCVDIAWKLLASALVFLIGSMLIKLLLKLFPNGKRFVHFDETVRIFLNNFIRIALYCVLAVIIIGIMGVPMASVITVFATAGAAIALAVQGSLANFMGGIMLLIFRPVKVGEFIDVGGACGTVTEVGFFYTQIRTADNVHVSIPNGTMTGSVITNYSREELRRAVVTIGVAYTSDVEKVKEVVDKVLKANDRILSDPVPFVRVTNMMDSSLEITILAWCKSEDWATVRSDLYEECKVAFEKAGIEIPFTQIDIHTR